MKVLEEFILETPYLFLKKIPYAWVFVVFFWSWPPVVSGIILAIVLAGLLMMAWQERAWETRVMREYSSGEAKALIDRPHASRLFQVRNLALLGAASGLVGWLLNGRIGISGMQWFFLLTGFMLLYKDTKLLGAGVTYMLTDQGIGIRFVPGHVDYRLFFKYGEIRQAARIRIPEELPVRWNTLIPVKRMKEGVLLSATNPDGFSKEIQGELLLAPADRGRFLEVLERHVVVREEGLGKPG